MKVYTTSEDPVVVDVSSANGKRAYVQIETPTGIVSFDDASAEQLEYAVRAARIGAQAINIGTVRPKDDGKPKVRAWLGGPLKHKHEWSPTMAGSAACLTCGVAKS